MMMFMTSFPHGWQSGEGNETLSATASIQRLELRDELKNVPRARSLSICPNSHSFALNAFDRATVALGTQHS